MIAGIVAATSAPMSRFHPVLGTINWFVANAEALILGAIVAAAIVAVMLALRIYGRKIVADALEADDQITWKSVLGRVMAKTTILFMVAAALDTVTTYAEPGPKIGRLIDILFTVAAGLQGAIWARELILGLIARRVRIGANESALSSAMAIIRVLVSFALYAIAIILILDNLGVNVTALVAGLGIGGIAIGLAAQGIFSDLFAALSILFDKPFKKGDMIRYDDSTGTVERIGLKTTRIRSLTGEQLIMANTKLLEREIHNLAQAKARRMTLAFGLTYQTSPENLARIEDFARDAVENRKGCKLVRCVMLAFGPSSLDHELVYDDRSLDNDMLAQNRAAIMLELMKRFAAERVEFAYPTQTTFTAGPDGSFVMPYAQPRQ